MTVLDASDAGGDGALDSDRRIGVGGNVCAPIVGGLDGGTQLGLGEGRDVEWTERRGHAAARGELHLGGTLHQLLAGAHAHLVGTVGNHAGADPLHAAEHAADGSRQIRELAEVAMTTGDGDDGAGWIDARTGDEVLVDGLLEAEARPAHVAHRREAAHQRRGRFAGGEQIVVADIAREGGHRRRAHQHCVPMRIDQPRHQHATAAVDHQAGGCDIRGRDLLDLSIPDQDIGRG